MKQPLLKDVTDYESYSSDDSNSIFNSTSKPTPVPAPVDINASVGSLVNVPKDKYNIVYIIFFIQGVGMLMPWNLFITASDYFHFKFQHDHYARDRFENAFSVAAMVPNVLSLLVNIFLTSRLSRNARVIPSLLITVIIFVLTTVFVEINTQSWAHGFFLLTVLTVAILNTAIGIFQGALFGVAGVVGGKYTQAIMMGQGMAGIFVAVANILTKIGQNDVRASALAYFIVACVVIIISVVAYSVLFKMPLMEFYFARLERKIAASQKRTGIFGRKKQLAVNADMSSSLDNGSLQRIQTCTASPPYWLIFKQIAPLALSVAFVFLVTLSLFPSIISGIHSVNEDNGSEWNKKYFSPMVCFLLFNAGDFVGRLIAGHVQIAGERGYFLPLLCLVRVVFIPLFMFCNYQPRRHGTAYFNNDFAPVILNFLLSLSNGYLGSLCMMFGPKRVPPEHTETAGTIMAFFLTFGLSLGAGFSFVLASII